MAFVPRQRRCALRGANAAALPGAPAIRRQNHPGAHLPLRGIRRLHYKLKYNGELEVPKVVDPLKRHQAYLWGNSAYLLAQRATAAFSRYGWPAAIRGVEGGGLVEGLPVHTFSTGEGDQVMKCPTEV